MSRQLGRVSQGEVTSKYEREREPADRVYR